MQSKQTFISLRLKPGCPEDMKYCKQLSNNDILFDNERINFDYICNENCDNYLVFQQTTLHILQYFMTGQDCLVCTYGTAQSGKSLKMRGSSDKQGIIQLIVFQLLNLQYLQKQSAKMFIKCFIFDNEYITDLLNEESLKQEYKNNTPMLHIEILSFQHFEQVLHNCYKKRSYKKGYMTVEIISQVSKISFLEVQSTVYESQIFEKIISQIIYKQVSGIDQIKLIHDSFYSDYFSNFRDCVIGIIFNIHQNKNQANEQKQLIRFAQQLRTIQQNQKDQSKQDERIEILQNKIEQLEQDMQNKDIRYREDRFEFKQTQAELMSKLRTVEEDLLQMKKEKFCGQVQQNNRNILLQAKRSNIIQTMKEQNIKLDEAEIKEQNQQKKQGQKDQYESSQELIIEKKQLNEQTSKEQDYIEDRKQYEPIQQQLQSISINEPNKEIKNQIKKQKQNIEQDKEEQKLYDEFQILENGQQQQQNYKTNKGGQRNTQLNAQKDYQELKQFESQQKDKKQSKIQSIDSDSQNKPNKTNKAINKKILKKYNDDCQDEEELNQQNEQKIKDKKQQQKPSEQLMKQTQQNKTNKTNKKIKNNIEKKQSNDQQAQEELKVFNYKLDDLKKLSQIKLKEYNKQFYMDLNKTFRSKIIALMTEIDNQQTIMNKIVQKFHFQLDSIIILKYETQIYVIIKLQVTPSIRANKLKEKLEEFIIFDNKPSVVEIENMILNCQLLYRLENITQSLEKQNQYEETIIFAQTIELEFKNIEKNQIELIKSLFNMLDLTDYNNIIYIGNNIIKFIIMFQKEQKLILQDYFNQHCEANITIINSKVTFEQITKFYISKMKENLFTIKNTQFHQLKVQELQEEELVDIYK